MTNFFERPLIPLQPNPEPEEFPLYRDMQFRRIADLQADPYGGQKFSNQGRGTFDPRSGGYGPSNVSRQGSGGPGQPRTVGPRPTGGGGGGQGQGGMDIGRLLQMLAKMSQAGGGGQTGHDGQPLPKSRESLGVNQDDGVDDPNVDAVAQMLMERPALMQKLIDHYQKMQPMQMKMRQPMQKMLPRGRSAAPMMKGEDAMPGPGLPGPYESNFPAGTAFPATATAGATPGGGGGTGGGGGGGGMPRMRPKRKPMGGYDAGVLPGRPGQGGWRDIPDMERQMGNVQGSGYGTPTQQTPNGPAVPRHTNPSAPQPNDPRFSRFTQMNPGAHGGTGTTPHYTDPNNPFGMANSTPAPAAVASTVAAGHDGASRVMRGMRRQGGGGGRPMPGGGPSMGPSIPGAWGGGGRGAPSTPKPPPTGRTPADALAGGGGWGTPSGGFPHLRGL